MINWDILTNDFLFDSNFLKISTGITQRLPISSLGINLEEIVKLIDQALLKLKILKFGTKDLKEIQLHSHLRFKRSKYVGIVKTKNNGKLILTKTSFVAH